MSKRKSSKEINPMTEAFRDVAKRRAAHFARYSDGSSKSSAISSTPTGIEVLSESQDNIESLGNEVNAPTSWPGPFSTAYEMISNRDEARKQREETIRKGDIQNDSDKIGVDSDEYDKMLKASKSSYTKSIAQHQDCKHKAHISSLVDISLNYIVQHFEQVVDLGNLSVGLRSSLATELAKRRLLTPSAVKLIAVPGLNCLLLPECSSLDEDLLSQLISQLSSFSGTSSYDTSYLHSFKSQYNTSSDEFDASGVEVIELRNCGYGVSDRIANLLSKSFSKSLCVLTLSGSYRLSDDALSSLLSSCHQIRALDLSYGTSLNTLSLRSITNLRHLTSLALDYCTCMEDKHLIQLAEACPSGLVSLSISGLHNITDSGIEQLFFFHQFHPKINETSSTCYHLGPKLRKLSLCDCRLLTDKSMAVLKRSCRSLHFLDLSRLYKVSEKGLSLLFSASADSNDEEITEHDAHKEIYYEGESHLIGHIAELALEGLSKAVTDNVVVAISKKLDKTLRKIKLNGCSHLTGKSIIALKRHCSRNIEDIDVSFIRGIEEYALYDFMMSCPNLSQVSVWGCSQLSHMLNDFLKTQNMDERVKIIGLMHR